MFLLSPKSPANRRGFWAFLRAGRVRPMRPAFCQLADCTNFLFEICIKLPIDIYPIICYNNYRKNKKEVIKMKDLFLVLVGTSIGVGIAFIITIGGSVALAIATTIF